MSSLHRAMGGLKLFCKSRPGESRRQFESPNWSLEEHGVSPRINPIPTSAMQGDLDEYRRVRPRGICRPMLSGISSRRGHEGFFVTDAPSPVWEEMGPSLQRRVSRVITRDYDRVSQVWDGSFVPATDAIRHQILDMAELEPGERVLDVGTGTGAAALLAAKRVGKMGRVLGIDMSAAMLAKARAKASRSDLTNITFRRMDASALQLPIGSFDVIVSSFGTPEGVYDGEAVFRDWLRVLRSGGRLCFAESPGLTSFYATLRRLLEKHKVENPSPAWAERRRLWEEGREERRRKPPISGDEPATVVRLMKAAGFCDVRVRQRRSHVLLPSTRTILRLFLHWDIADEYAEMSPVVRAAFRRDLLRAVRRYEAPDGVRLPSQTNFFFGRKRAGGA